jgi:hypothetical protein
MLCAKAQPGVGSPDRDERQGPLLATSAEEVPHGRQAPLPSSSSTRLVGLAVAAGAALALVAPATGRAAIGSVYVDPSFNVGAGHDFFGHNPPAPQNVRLGYSVMPNLTSGNSNTALGNGALLHDTAGSGNVAPARARSAPTPPAATTSPPAPRRSPPTPPAPTTSPPAATRSG